MHSKVAKCWSRIIREAKDDPQVEAVQFLVGMMLRVEVVQFLVGMMLEVTVGQTRGRHDA
jgi:hypothetical protein